ncbi:hypothetical protein MAP00_007948 [Monascus purpureus]|nr:hypothetical protein MAP00_007948 [Monascus purpureus]
MSPMDFWAHSGRLSLKYEMLLTVYDSLETLKIQPSYHPFHLPIGPLDDSKPNWLCTFPPAEEDKLSLDSHLSPGIACFICMAGRHYGPIYCPPFASYRKYGLAIWGLKRIVDLGLDIK